MRGPAFFLVLVGCAEVDSPDPERVLPEKYRETFVEVLGCRPSIEHDLAHVIVRMSPELAPAYRGGPFPFPRGALVIKEQYGVSDARCSQLSGWTIMRKEAAGYHPAGGDWRWFKIDQRERILEDGKIARCVKCHTGCKARDYVCGE